MPDVGRCVRILHNRAGLSQVGEITEFRAPDTFLVLMDGETGVIPATVDGFELLPVAPEPVPEPEPTIASEPVVEVPLKSAGFFGRLFGRH